MHVGNRSFSLPQKKINVNKHYFDKVLLSYTNFSRNVANCKPLDSSYKLDALICFRNITQFFKHIEKTLNLLCKLDLSET